jgi:hypothetical protein
MHRELLISIELLIIMKRKYFKSNFFCMGECTYGGRVFFYQMWTVLFCDSAIFVYLQPII